MAHKNSNPLLIGLVIYVLLLIAVMTFANVGGNEVFVVALVAFGTAYFRHRVRRGSARPAE